MNRKTSKNIVSWAVAALKISPEARRRASEATVLMLMRSIARRGLLSPIRIRPDGTVICGRHRVLAHERLGWEMIDVIIDDGDPVDVELDEVEENLARRELTVLERAELECRQKALYLEKYPDTQQGLAGARGKHLRAKSVSFAAARAEVHGGNRRMVEQRIQIAVRLGPDIIVLLAETRIADNHTRLLELARAPEELRLTVAKHLAASDSTNVREALAVVGGAGAIAAVARRTPPAATNSLVEFRGGLLGTAVVAGRTIQFVLDKDLRSFVVREVGTARTVEPVRIPVDRRGLTLAMTADLSSEVIHELPEVLATHVTLGPIESHYDYSGTRSPRLIQTVAVIGSARASTFQVRWLDATERLSVRRGTVLLEVDRRSFVLGHDGCIAEQVRQALRDALFRALAATGHARTELGRLYLANGKEWTFLRVDRTPPRAGSDAASMALLGPTQAPVAPQLPLRSS